MTCGQAVSHGSYEGCMATDCDSCNSELSPSASDPRHRLCVSESGEARCVAGLLGGLRVAMGAYL